MRAVVYNRDLDPITIVELSAGVAATLWEHRHLRVYIRQPQPFRHDADGDALFKSMTVVITAELFRHNGATGARETLALFVNDEAASLMRDADTKHRNRQGLTTEQVWLAESFDHYFRAILNQEC